MSWHPCRPGGHRGPRGGGRAVYLGYIVISDEVKPDAKEAIAALKAPGVTQDRHAHRRRQGRGRGRGRRSWAWTRSTPSCCPADKVERVEALLQEKSRKGEAWPLWATASTTRPCSPGRTSASPWAPWAPTPPSRPPTWCSWTTSPPRSPRPSASPSSTLRIVRQNIVFALAVKLLVLVLGAVGPGQHVGGRLRRRGRDGAGDFKCLPGLASGEEIN